MYLIDTRKYDDSFLLAKILEKVNITDEEKKKLFKHFEKPEVVDAVPVIRCKDCKKYIPCHNLPIGTSKWCDLFDRATCEMNYCGWGERREDGNNDRN